MNVSHEFYIFCSKYESWNTHNRKNNTHEERENRRRVVVREYLKPNVTTRPAKRKDENKSIVCARNVFL